MQTADRQHSQAKGRRLAQEERRQTVAVGGACQYMYDGAGAAFLHERRREPHVGGPSGPQLLGSVSKHLGAGVVDIRFEQAELSECILRQCGWRHGRRQIGGLLVDHEGAQQVGAARCLALTCAGAAGHHGAGWKRAQTG